MVTAWPCSARSMRAFRGTDTDNKSGITRPEARSARHVSRPAMRAARDAVTVAPGPYDAIIRPPAFWRDLHGSRVIPNRQNRVDLVSEPRRSLALEARRARQSVHRIWQSQRLPRRCAGERLRARPASPAPRAGCTVTRCHCISSGFSACAMRERDWRGGDSCRGRLADRIQSQRALTRATPCVPGTARRSLNCARGRRAQRWRTPGRCFCAP
jgi:hypothetical protein